MKTHLKLAACGALLPALFMGLAWLQAEDTPADKSDEAPAADSAPAAPAEEGEPTGDKWSQIEQSHARILKKLDGIESDLNFIRLKVARSRK